jgi:hypothetical protein
MLCMDFMPAAPAPRPSNPLRTNRQHLRERTAMHFVTPMTRIFVSAEPGAHYRATPCKPGSSRRLAVLPESNNALNVSHALLGESHHTNPANKPDEIKMVRVVGVVGG